MTLDALIKCLTKLRAKTGGRVDVAMDAREAIESCNGVFNIISIKGAYFEYISLCDGDGFRIENKDGTERYQKTIVLSVYKKR